MHIHVITKTEAHTSERHDVFSPARYPVEGQLRDHNTEHRSPRLPRCFRNTFWALWIRTNFYITLVTHCSDILLLSPFKFHCCEEDWLAQFHQVFPLQKPATISTEQTRKLWPCSHSKPNSLAPESKVFIVLCCPNLKGIVLGLDGETILCLNPKQDGKPVCSHLALCSEGFPTDETWVPAHKESLKPSNLKYLVEPHPPWLAKSSIPEWSRKTGHGHAGVWLCRGHTVSHLAKGHKGGLSENPTTWGLAPAVQKSDLLWH